MRVDAVKGNSGTFGAKVSQDLVDMLRFSINTGENRLKNNYQFTKKLEEFKDFGYDDYTVGYHKKDNIHGRSYNLIATRDGDDSRVLFLKKCNTLNQFLSMFNNMTKGEFRNRMSKHHIYYSM